MSFDAKKFCQVIGSIHSKVPLPELNAKLRELSLPSASSWLKINQVLGDLASGKLTPIQESCLNNLVRWIDSYLSYSNKIVLIFNLGAVRSSKISKLADNAELLMPSLNVLSTHPGGEFPALATAVQAGGNSGRVILRERRKYSAGTEFVFSSFKEYQIRENVPLTKVDAAALPKISPYYKIIGLKRVVFEHVDIVRVSDSLLDVGVGSIEFLLDGMKPGGTSLNADEIRIRSELYMSIFDKVCAASSVGDLPDPRNFYTAMDKIYNTKREGNICELYFTTTIGGSVKREKMKRNTADLRNETWHAGGRTAIAKLPTPDTIDIYRLSVSWKLMFSSDEPILSILGTYRDLSTGKVVFALISGCTESSSFEYALSRLIKYT